MLIESFFRLTIFFRHFIPVGVMTAVAVRTREGFTARRETLGEFFHPFVGKHASIGLGVMTVHGGRLDLIHEPIDFFDHELVHGITTDIIAHKVRLRNS